MSFPRNDESAVRMRDEKQPNIVIRVIDHVVVRLIKVLMHLAFLKSRDPRDHPANLLKPDRVQQSRIRNWQGVLEWSPEKRVGCFSAVLIGIAIGGAMLWFGLM